MCPGVMRLTDPRFLSDWRHKDFRYFLTTQVGDLGSDQNVDNMVELCFAKKQRDLSSNQAIGQEPWSDRENFYRGDYMLQWLPASVC